MKRLQFPLSPLSEARGYKWIVLFAAVVSQATAAFVTQGIPVLAGFLQAQLQLSTSQTGLLVSSCSIAPIFSLLLIGDLLDRKSERVIMLAGAVLVTAGMLLAAGTSTNMVVYAGLIMVGLGYSTAQPGGSRSISSWFDSSIRGMAMGIRQAGLPLGGAIAAAALPAITVAFGWRTAFRVCAVVSLIGGIFFYATYRPRFSHAAAPRRLADKLSGIKDIVARPRVQRAMIAGIAMVATQYAIVVFLMLFLHGSFGIGLQRSAILLVLVQGFGAAGRIVTARLTDVHAQNNRLGAVRFSMLATCMGLLAMLLFPAISWSSWLLLSAWLGFFALGWYGPWITEIVESASAKHVGLTLGLALTANQLSIVIVPPLLGAIYDLGHDFRIVWGLVIAWTMLAYCLTSPRRMADWINESKSR